jgi:hypothetical protein
MISLKLNEAQAEWGAATLARIAEGVATGGLALPELMAVSFVEYLTTVQGLTPPAKGARVIGSVDLSRGKAAIDVDLGRAFIVSAKGVASNALVNVSSTRSHTCPSPRGTATGNNNAAGQTAINTNAM